MRSLIGCSLSNVLWNKTTNSELDNLISVFVDSVLKLLNCSSIACFRYSQRERKPKGWVLWFEKWWVVPLLQSNLKFILRLSPSPSFLICNKSVWIVLASRNHFIAYFNLPMLYLGKITDKSVRSYAWSVQIWSQRIKISVNWEKNAQPRKNFCDHRSPQYQKISPLA